MLADPVAALRGLQVVAGHEGLLEEDRAAPGRRA